MLEFVVSYNSSVTTVHTVVLDNIIIQLLFKNED